MAVCNEYGPPNAEAPEFKNNLELIVCQQYYILNFCINYLT